MKFQWGLHIVWGILVLISFSCKKNSNQPIPLIIGHAGTSLSEERAVFPPNTINAIFYGMDGLNADGVEVDVQMTKDCVLVLYHNELLEDFTDLTGCINDHNLAEIRATKYYTNYTIATLKEVIEITKDKKKYLFIDSKQTNVCTGENVDFTAFDWALTKDLFGLTKTEKERIIINSRNSELLLTISDTKIKKSFSTDDIDNGISFFQDNDIDLLLFRKTGMNEKDDLLLKSLHIPYALFNIKTKKDIQLVGKYSPFMLITDNISSTRKYYY